MFSKLFGKKTDRQESSSSQAYQSDWSFIGTDIHSHFIPGIDDGSQTIEDSIALIRGMKEMGFRNIVTTPHIKYDHYPNTSDTILNGLATVHQALKENGIDIPVRAAAEYYIDDHFMNLLDTQPLLTIWGNEVLVELSFMFEPINFYNILFKIQTSGYQPILAHPERYAYYHDKPQVFKELKDRGFKLQLNTIALTGYYGRSVKVVAESLLQQGLYDYCGSDMHHLRHADQLRKLQSMKIYHTLQHYPFQNPQIVFN